jgi:hypothetical protein
MRLLRAISFRSRGVCLLITRPADRREALGVIRIGVLSA